MSKFCKLALGTAQMGMSYGLTNKSGKIKKIEANRILKNAHSKGIRLLDTASTYGNSEKLIGEFGNDKFQVCTKFKIDSFQSKDLDSLIEEEVNSSLKNLNLNNLEYLLIHDLDLLDSDNGIKTWRALKSFQEKGLINKLGFSIYSPEDLERLYKKYSPDIIQTPFSIIDQRIKQTGWLQILSENNVEIHARSVFLQGILLSEFSELPSYFSKWSYVWSEINNLCSQYQLSKLQLLLSYPVNEKRISKIIVGVASNKELDQIFNAYNKSTNIYINFDHDSDSELIDPRRWP